MFISISATVALDKYQWYTYLGKKPKVFDDHHRNHEAELESGDIFGIRKYSDKYKLVDLSEPKVVFTVSAKEVYLLRKNSKGYSGKHSGIKLSPGVGGKDKGVKLEELDTDLYPVFPLPPSKKKLGELYEHFRKKYFDKECPELNELAIKFAGKGRFTGRSVYKAGKKPNFELQFASRGVTNVKRVINVLLHEMIHLHFFYMWHTTEDPYYYRESGHTDGFKEWMNYLNTKGYEVQLKEDVVENVATEFPIYILGIKCEWEGDNPSYWENGMAIYWSLKSIDKDKVDAIVNQVKKFLSSSYLDPVRTVVGISRNPNAMLFPRVPSTKIPSKKVRVYTHDSKVDDIIKGLSSQEITDLDVSDEFRALQSGIDYSVNDLFESFPVYRSRVLQNSLGFKYAASSYNKLGEKEKELIYKSWRQATDAALLNSDVVKNIRKNMLRWDLDKEEAIEYLVPYYLNNFEGRRSPEEFANLIVKMVGDIVTLPKKEFESRLLDAVKAANKG